MSLCACSMSFSATVSASSLISTRRVFEQLLRARFGREGGLGIRHEAFAHGYLRFE